MQAGVLVTALVVTVFFVAMIRPYLVTILMAAIFAGLFHPLYARCLRLVKGHRNLAAAAVLLLVFLIVIIPLVLLSTLAVQQALEVSGSARPWIEHQLSQPDPWGRFAEAAPILDKLGLDRTEILKKAAEIVQGLGGFFVDQITNLTGRTVRFLFHLFLFSYALFFLLKDGGQALRKILVYTPMTHEDEMLMLDRFVSVTRAMIKGTFAIGILQGVLGGAGFAMVHLPAPVFWGAVMVVLSIIPGIGTGLLWVPATFYLLVSGRTTAAVLLALWFLLIVGMVDNFLRPLLVGKDTRMSELLILFSTLGGLALWGIAGLLLGPIVAALFVTIWEIYGEVFAADLPPVGPIGRSDPPLGPIDKE